MNNRERHKKLTEWNAIRNLIPSINKFLQIEISQFEEKYSQERPDFVFSYKKKSIGIEVIECHPSTRENKKFNTSACTRFYDKFCEDFLNNDFLLSITKDTKYNILIYRKTNFKKENVVNASMELEAHLTAWYYNEAISLETEFIRKIRVMETKGRNIVQFNNFSRRSPVDWCDLESSIQVKNTKYEDYLKNLKCDEFWLCIFLPFEENRESNTINYGGKENKALEFLLKSPFQRICITSEIPITDIFWLKDMNKALP